MSDKKSNFVNARNAIEDGFVSLFHSLQSLLGPQLVQFAKEDAMKIGAATVVALQGGTVHGSDDLIKIVKSNIDAHTLQTQGIQLATTLSTAAAAGVVHLAQAAPQEDPGKPPETASEK